MVDPTRCQLKDIVRQLMVRVKTKHSNQTTFIRKNHLTPTGTLKNRTQTSTGKFPVKKQTNPKVGIFLILITYSPHEKISQKLIINLTGQKMGFEDWKDTCPPKEVPEKILEDVDVGEPEHQPNQTGNIQKENTEVQDTKLPSPPNTPLDLTNRQRKNSEPTKQTPLKIPIQNRRAKQRDRKKLSQKAPKNAPHRPKKRVKNRVSSRRLRLT